MAPPTLNENQFTHSGDKTTFYYVPKEPSAYALEHHVSDMLALLTHLGRDKAVWIGHDWGAVIVWALAAQHPEKCVGVCCMAAPYHVPELGLEALLAVCNREPYPEDQYPLAQWDYQAFQIEQPDTSAAQLRANVPNTIKLLFRSGSPESYGKPSLLASLRKSGGWFGGAPAAPDLPFETTLFKDDKPAFDRMVAEFERNGFEGPNDYYRNHEANKAYIEKAPNEGRLCYPVLFIEARRDNEKPEETNAAIVRWIATKLPTYFPGYWKTPFVSRV
ncbi:Alpha/Beta hydrolase protein [Fusarium sp. MPI-SDFR-AT-0072]|nr:Alpha/Beta hydrolase protein [Fusarium sp. MPI-SDFR-AT-0072]